MIYCFDTSAINALHDDPERDAIISGFLATSTVRVTALNIVEACGTEDVERRRSLISLEKQLAGDFRPLAIPNELLQTLAIAQAKRDSQAVITIGEKQNGIWIALNDPSLLGEEARQEVLSWKEGLEESFKDTHKEARPHFQELFEQGDTPRPKTASELIRHYCGQEEFLYEVVAPMYQRATGAQLPREGFRRFFSEIPQWPLYLLGWADAIFNRAMRKEKYGPRGKPDTIDLWCAVYLPHCDRFVTNDAGQRRALRVLNVLNPRGTKILSYTELRSNLLIG